eukprot:Skav206377  [mRNA]  locus=scaffold834:275412:280399:+ [translate_table: standard]
MGKVASAASLLFAPHLIKPLHGSADGLPTSVGPTEAPPVASLGSVFSVPVAIVEAYCTPAMSMDHITEPRACCGGTETGRTETGISAPKQLEEPLFCDQPFTKKYPPPPAVANNPLFYLCCMASKMPNVRGIPNGSTPMPEEEARNLMKKLEGNWHIQVLESMGKSQFQYEEVMVRDNYYVMRDAKQNGQNSQSPRKPPFSSGENVQEGSACRNIQDAVNLRACEIYLDFIGSQLVKMDFDGGEVELNNGCLNASGLKGVSGQLLAAKITSEKTIRYS